MRSATGCAREEPMETAPDPRPARGSRPAGRSAVSVPATARREPEKMPDATTTRREVRNPAWCHNMCLLIDGGPQAVPLARHALDGLADRLDRELLFDIHLLVSELVANSVRHGGSEATEKIGLRVDLSSRHVRVEVADGGPGFAGGSPEPEPEAT